MFESREARLVGTLEGPERRRLAGATAGVLLDKSMQLSADVHLAMQARGFRGDVRLLEDPRLGEERVGRAASVVAAIPEVRAALIAFQRGFAAAPPSLTTGAPARGAVLDGRDIGSAVCPDADVKVFITATPEERARRRVEELRGRGAPAIYETVLQDLMERDARDSSRHSAPLRAAPDAVVIDTTKLDADAVFGIVEKLVARSLARPR